jgi:hypothetical protein
MKSFHEVRAGNVHEYLLKSSIGKVRWVLIMDYSSSERRITSLSERERAYKILSRMAFLS